MELSARQIKEKRKIGLWNGVPVLNLLTKGGFNVIASAKDGVTKILGMAPFASLAKHIASMAFPDVEWEDSLSKSEKDTFDPQLVKKYSDLTDRIRRLSDD